MKHSHIIQVHHPSGMLYEAFCSFSVGLDSSSFFQSDGFFRFARAWPGAEVTLLVALARAPQAEEPQVQAETKPEESLFPGGALLFRGHPKTEPEEDLERGEPWDKAGYGEADGPGVSYASGGMGSPSGSESYGGPVGSDVSGSSVGSDGPEGMDATGGPGSPQAANGPAHKAGSDDSGHAAAKPKPGQDPGARWKPGPSPDMVPGHAEETSIPGLGRVVGSLLAVTFRERKGWRWRWGWRTVVFGGPLLGEGTRLDGEVRLRGLLNALPGHIKQPTLSVEVHCFLHWDRLVPVFRELGYSHHDRPVVADAWAAVEKAAQKDFKLDGAGVKRPADQMRRVPGPEAPADHMRRVPEPEALADHMRGLPGPEALASVCAGNHGVFLKVLRPLQRFLIKTGL